MTFIFILFTYTVFLLLGLLFLRVKPRGAIAFVIMHGLSVFAILKMNAIGEIASAMGNSSIPLSLMAVGLVIEEAIKITVAFIAFLYFVEHNNHYSIKASIRRFHPYAIMSAVTFALAGNILYFYSHGSLANTIDVIFMTTFMPIIHVFPVLIFSIVALKLDTFGILSGLIAMGVSRIILDSFLSSNVAFETLIGLSVVFTLLWIYSSKQRDSKNIVEIPN